MLLPRPIHMSEVPADLFAHPFSSLFNQILALYHAAVGGLFLWHAYSSVYYLHYLLTTTNAF